MEVCNYMLLVILIVCSLPCCELVPIASEIRDGKQGWSVPELGLGHQLQRREVQLGHQDGQDLQDADQADPLPSDPDAEDGPLISDQGSDGPLISDQGNDGPLISDQGNDGPLLSDQGNDGPLISHQADDGPIVADQIDDGPIISDHSNTLDAFTGVPDIGQQNFGDDDLAVGANHQGDSYHNSNDDDLHHENNDDSDSGVQDRHIGEQGHITDLGTGGDNQLDPGGDHQVLPAGSDETFASGHGDTDFSSNSSHPVGAQSGPSSQQGHHDNPGPGHIDNHGNTDPIHMPDHGDHSDHSGHTDQLHHDPSEPLLPEDRDHHAGPDHTEPGHSGNGAQESHSVDQHNTTSDTASGEGQEGHLPVAGGQGQPVPDPGTHVGGAGGEGDLLPVAHGSGDHGSEPGLPGGHHGGEEHNHPSQQEPGLGGQGVDKGEGHPDPDQEHLHHGESGGEGNVPAHQTTNSGINTTPYHLGPGHLSTFSTSNSGLIPTVKTVILPTPAGVENGERQNNDSVVPHRLEPSVSNETMHAIPAGSENQTQDGHGHPQGEGHSQSPNEGEKADKDEKEGSGDKESLHSYIIPFPSIPTGMSSQPHRRLPTEVPHTSSIAPSFVIHVIPPTQHAGHQVSVSTVQSTVTVQPSSTATRSLQLPPGSSLHSSPITNQTSQPSSGQQQTEHSASSDRGQPLIPSIGLHRTEQVLPSRTPATVSSSTAYVTLPVMPELHGSSRSTEVSKKVTSTSHSHSTDQGSSTADNIPLSTETNEMWTELEPDWEVSPTVSEFVTESVDFVTEFPVEFATESASTGISATSSSSFAATTASVQQQTTPRQQTTSAQQTTSTQQTTSSTLRRTSTLSTEQPTSRQRTTSMQPTFPTQQTTSARQPAVSHSTTSPSTPGNRTTSFRTTLAGQTSLGPSGPTTEKTTLINLLTTRLPTTKIKVTVPHESHNTTTAGPSTTKHKPVVPATTKPPDKPPPDNTTSPAGVATGGTTRPIPVTTLFTTHDKPVITTPPPLFVEIDLKMSWTEFCDSKGNFITELLQIIRNDQGEIVFEAQITFINDCEVNNLMMQQSRTLTVVQFYLVDSDGKINLQLTIDCSKVVETGFKKNNSFFKDKIIGAKLVGGGQTKSESPTDSPVTKAKMTTGITMVIVIASVGGCCCIVLIVLQVMINRRNKSKMRPYVSGQRASIQSTDTVALGIMPKSRPNSGYWNPALDEQEEVPEHSQHSHLVNFAGLSNFSMEPNGIYEEFQLIPCENPGLSSVPVGAEDKNRYANVLPFKHTRVRLKKQPGVDTSDYINANYITGYRNDKGAYIATQAPMKSTIDDFWRMVWEQQSRAILMLVPMESNGQPWQCPVYWPDPAGEGSRKLYGDYVVSMKRRDIQQDYVESVLEIKDIETNLMREVHHFWYTNWPRTGSTEPLSLVKFILDTRPHYEDSGAPVIVHCGPGTGRTGVLIAVDISMRRFEDKRRVDILQCVHNMRQERASAVQSKEQYALIYKAMNEYAVILSSPSVSTRSSVITLHAML